MKLLREEDCQRIAEVALKASSAEHTFVSVSDTASSTARFANNQIVQNVATRESQITVRVSTGRRAGSASTSELGDDAIRDTVRRAAEIANIAPEDPEHLAPLGPQHFPIRAAYRIDTAEAGPARLLRDARIAIAACRQSAMDAAGIASATTSVSGLAASSGLRAYEPRTQASFSLTATLRAGTPEASSGWAADTNRSIDDLQVAERTAIAIEKARRSADPRELPPGRYTAILEPAAVAGLLGPLVGATRAKAYFRGTSALADKLGRRIIDERLTLQNRPEHPALLGSAFNGEGLPSDHATWIDCGVLARLDYDRFTAKEMDAAPSYPLDAPHLSGRSPAGETVESLMQGAGRAILVTNFWYIRGVSPRDLTLTGMTRDGTFLVEDGRIICGVRNFRWHDSPLRVFSNVEAFTPPMDATSQERGKMLLPAIVARDFNFSSVTKF